MVAGFEVSGVAGMLISGWLTDRVFGGRGARLCVISMALAAATILAIWKLGSTSLWLNTLLLCLVGFFLYGPQALVGVVVVNLATKRLAATAIGFTAMFSYASTLLSGWGLGTLVEHCGWNTALAGMAGTAMLSTLFFAMVWPAKAHGYATAPSSG
jgi:OPA family glycerol-3-phosphate transporter-like MFS transporter/OPA family sugar phosphate sensor protein UhpC-like MFS transporter